MDSVIERALDYEVRWPDGAGQPGLATLAVTYQHLRPVPEHVCNLRPRYGNTYDDMAARCYYNYLRLYAPKGSQLIGIDGVAADSVTHKRGEKETELFAGYMVLKPGEQQTVTFTYHLPASIIPENYQLHLQRQSGTGSLPLELAVRGEDFSTIVVDGRFRWELAGGNWVD